MEACGFVPELAFRMRIGKEFAGLACLALEKEWKGYELEYVNAWCFAIEAFLMRNFSDFSEVNRCIRFHDIVDGQKIDKMILTPPRVHITV